MAEIDDQERFGKNLIPLYLNLKSKLIVIFGGGKVGERKAILFSQYSRVQVVSKNFTTNLIEQSQKGTLELIRADLYEDYARYLQGAFIVVPATNDADLNRAIEKKANDLGIMINKVDGVGDIVVPSIVRRDPVTIAISTESPALSKYLRLKLEKYLREDYQGMARLLGHIRRELKESVPLQNNRSKIVWNILEDKEVWRLLNESYEKAYMRAREHAMRDEQDCLNASYSSQGLH
ncbi:MAG: bifunctional precorrin-2 dehydrogenase/sirohydrochlorin ferrochelatase [Methanotrichaceae archaeon]|nr:bifunctional precorrin-2 dehydrogenase/sirohydrochlorin ferrochelatase [Methanotrichaceae archaeon]